MGFLDRIAEFDEIAITPLTIESRRIIGRARIRRGNQVLDFTLIFRYTEPVEIDRNLAGLILTMPAINFTLFSKRLTLDFPASPVDVQAVRDFVAVNNREVFINKLMRRRYEFFNREFLPSDSDLTEESSRGLTEVVASAGFTDHDRAKGSGSVAVLSSGGKESLLTFGMLKEIDPGTHAFFFNESGTHWLLAKQAYDYYSAHFGRTHKVWSNVDRFYRFMLGNMKSIDQHVIKGKTDTYPVQLFIFPVYVMSMIPIALKNGISGAVLGDEFDDPTETPAFHGIRHYYGVYDQTRDFNRYISSYLFQKGIDFRVWSAVYPINGSVVERMLMERYHELFPLQRSCHSCRSIGGKIVPCGRCSKCIGVMMFVLAGGGDPHIIGYSQDTVNELGENVSRERLRLDTDELNLMKARLGFARDIDVESLKHVSSVHILPDENHPFEEVPDRFRSDLMAIIQHYAPETSRLIDGSWTIVSQKKSD